jgi:hypothetical protein
MNNPFVLASAKQLADRVTHEGGPDDPAKLNWLFRTLFNRRPDPTELDIGRSLISPTGPGWQAYCQVLLCTNEFMYVD